MGKKLFIIYPGRFQIFHKGHRGVYDYLSTKYGGSDVYITTSNKVEPPKSPFNFEEKRKMMMLTGIPSSKIIQVASNYNIENLVKMIPINIKRDSIIFAVSLKDMMEDPRFSKFTKKDGTLTYLQPLPKKENQLKPAIEHGYIEVVPTTEFKVLGVTASSASELRHKYATLSTADKKHFIADLFGNYSPEIYDILNNKLGGLTEKQRNGIKKLIIGILKENENDVKVATRKANIALKVQREKEMRYVREKLKAAEDRLDAANSDEEKTSAQETINKLKDELKSKEELYKAALKQASSV